MKNSFLKEFNEREYFNQCTNLESLSGLMDKKKIRAYIGFDCTAQSLHVGSLLGQMGANSMTDGIYSQHGRLIKSLNKHVFDQTTCTAFPGSSGGGVYLKSDARYVGMLVRGAGEGFNLIVPVRRLQDYCEKHKIMWALDPKVPMPSDDDLKAMPIEHAPKEKNEDTAEEAAAKKLFPYMLRVTHPKVLILQRKPVE